MIRNNNNVYFFIRVNSISDVLLFIYKNKLKTISQVLISNKILRDRSNVRNGISFLRKIKLIKTKKNYRSGRVENIYLTSRGNIIAKNLYNIEMLLN